MGKGGGGGGAPPPTQQTVTQTNLPEYARPYFENIMERAQAESYRPYTPYGGERLAEFAPGQEAAQQEVAGMQTPGQFGVGTQMATAGGQQAMGYGGLGAGMGIGAAGTGQQALGYGGFGAGMGAMASGAGQDFFGMATSPGAQQAFMSPYMQNVVDVQKREAITDAQKQQLMANLGAARQGTYGGARQLLAGTERERALGQQLGDIQARGLQSAYDQAMKSMQFGSDIGLRGYQTGIEGARTGIQGVGQALQGYQTGLQGIGMGLQGAQQATQAGQVLGQLGQTQQQTDLQRIQAQAAAGAEQRGLEQQRLDMAYADFLRQRDYPMEQLGYYSNLLRGVPVQLGSTQTTYAQPPSLASQAAGLGLAGLGLYNLGRG
jgi:hypothetical protein